MASFSLETHNRQSLSTMMTDDIWVIACLCADWCGTCRDYRPLFNELAARLPEIQFVWIDIEDQADVVGELNVENFPTLLIQRGDCVAFFGTVLPDIQLSQRLLLAQIDQSDETLRRLCTNNAERAKWQSQCNLRKLILSVK